MNETGIIWTGATWNPVSGCQKVSQGCKFCYAESLAEKYRGTPAFPDGFDLTYRPHKLKEPLALKTPTLIFVNSMSDFFWDAISDEYRDKMLDVIKRTPQHQYQVLTKRPKKMVEYFTTRKVPSNFWCGVTIEDQANKERLGYLKQVDAEIRFISMEPLISPVFFEDDDLEGIHWIITGGESGLHLFKEDVRLHRSLVNLDEKTRKWTPREDRMDWIRMIRDACTASGVKYFHKQWGGHKPESAGRMLDGRTWNEMPRLPGTDTEIQNGYLKLLEARKEVTL